MDLPIKFPSNAKVIAEEAARFRAMSTEERIEVIRGILSAGEQMIRNSPKAEFLRAYTLEQEEVARRAIKEFVDRHAE